MTGLRDLMQQIRERVPEVTPQDVAQMLERGEELMLVDVREREEFEQGCIPGAVHIARGFLELRIEQLAPDRKTRIVLHCAGGTRSLLAADNLRALGYRNVSSLAGGFTRWHEEVGRVEQPVVLSAAERRRYARHLLIPEVGEKGQVALKRASVLLIGAGGLGSPAALYLAAAGVGRIGIVDFDAVDESNLQRQVLHATSRVGTSKVKSAHETLRDLNPEIEVVPIEERLSSTNVERILGGYDVVLDGSDNFPTRYLLNDACVLLQKPNVHGSVFRFEGQVTVLHPPHGPCYRCLYPQPPPPELTQSCAEAGVLGVLPGVVGLLQAVETIKLIVGIGQPLRGRLLLYDALQAEFREVRVRRDTDCAWCGDGKPFPGFVDYQQFCSGR